MGGEYTLVQIEPAVGPSSGGPRQGTLVASREGVSHPADRERHGHPSFFSRRKTAPAPSSEDYERRALEEIDQLKNPEPSRLGSALDVVHKPIASAADAALDNKLGEAISRAVQALMDKLNDRASWSVRAEAIYEAFCSGGHLVHDRHDIQQLELRDVDEIVGRLAVKSESLAFAEGASTGVLGLAGTALDIPGLLGIALRAINEYATYYGFDPSIDDEKAFVLMILAVVSAPTFEERQAAMAELTKLSVLLAEGDSRAESRRLLSMQMITKVAHTLASRLVRAKTAQAVPIVGAGIAAAFNAWFVRTLTQTAFHLYRERFLIAKRGPDVAVSVKG
jgi:hypothetical protein